MTEKRNLMIIVGAGFSHALNNKMPLCSNIMGTHINRVISDYKAKEDYSLFDWDVIGYLACYGFLGDSAEVKQAGNSLLAALAFHSHVDHDLYIDNYLVNETEFKSSPLREQYKTLLNDNTFITCRRKVVKDLFVDSAINRLLKILESNKALYEQLNIENLLAYELKHGFHNNPDAFGYYAFDKVVYEELQHGCDESDIKSELIALLKSVEDQFNISFLSFNYDLMLEQVVSTDKCDPFHCYDGIDFSHTVDVDDIRKASNDYWESIFDDSKEDTVVLTEKPYAALESMPLKIYKPHGSINWLGDYENGRMLLIDNPLGREIFIRGGSLWYVSSTGTKEPVELNTVLLPPAPSKFNSHPQLWEHTKRLEEALTKADCVMVIGWSCPPSDKSWNQRFQRIFEARRRQPASLIVFDTNKDVFDRIRNMIYPSFSVFAGALKKGALLQSLREQIVNPQRAGSMTIASSFSVQSIGN